ncbi:MAG: DDE-type integrase/transposase/recombinase [Verrucomicrobiales bacterium]|nr:DDE-type integrase/transposase/recombinase [Verrucomicrobiales bacterium]
MDFVTDRLEDGRYFRILTIVDQFTRECVALHAGQSLRGSDVAGSLSDAIEARAAPESITVDNGSASRRSKDDCL